MCVARVRRTPVSDASVDVRRARDETDSSRDGRRRDAPRVARMEVRGALEIRRRACVTGRRSRRWVSSHHALFVRSVGPPARALELGIATRARRSGTTIVSSSLARLAFSARARSPGSTSARARRPSEFRSGSFVAVEISAGTWRLARISVSKSATRRTKSRVGNEVDRSPRRRSLSSTRNDSLTPHASPDFPLPPSPPSPLSPAQPQTLLASTPNRPPCPS